MKKAIAGFAAAFTIGAMTGGGVVLQAAGDVAFWDKRESEALCEEYTACFVQVAHQTEWPSDAQSIKIARIYRRSDGTCHGSARGVLTAPKSDVPQGARIVQPEK